MDLVVGFATTSGFLAYPSAEDRPSPFTAALLSNLTEFGHVEDLANLLSKRIRDPVLALTRPIPPVGTEHVPQVVHVTTSLGLTPRFIAQRGAHVPLAPGGACTLGSVVDPLLSWLELQVRCGRCRRSHTLYAGRSH